MKTHSSPSKRGAQFLRWTARLFSVLSIAFVLLIFIGEFLQPTAAPIFALRDILAMLFFPIGVCLGLILAWRWERAGGIVSIASLAAFYLTLFAFDQRFPRGPYFLLVAMPGFFFLAAWFLQRQEPESPGTAMPEG
jgi:glucose-6-phosphate-specific signal transduction histidine kinase